jgi:hypothetical protein
MYGFARRSSLVARRSSLVARRWVARSLVLRSLIAGTALTMCGIMPGCASTPTQIEIENIYDQALKRLNAALELLLSQCAQDEACETQVRTWYTQMYQLIESGRLAAHERRWKDAEKRRDEWEKKFRDMLPGFPEIKPLLPWGSSATITTSLVSTPIQTVQNLTPAPWTQSLNISGDVAFDIGTFAANANCMGSLQIEFTQAANGSITGNVFAGSFFAKDTISDTTVTLTVEKDEANVLTLSTAGSGTITILFTRYVSDEAWNAVMPTFVRLRAPVTIDAAQRLHVDLENVTWNSIMPRTPYPVTDYNNDGVRDLASDRAAFLADWAAHANSRCDINGDGVWDQTDVTWWDEMFAEDTNN